jgi:hypothetical protein
MTDVNNETGEGLFFSAGFKKMREKENPKKIIATT